MSRGARWARRLNGLFGRIGLQVGRAARARSGEPGQLTRELVRRGLLRGVSVVDVGCSGGVHPRFAALEAELRAVGVDIVIDEVEALNASAPRGTRYVAARLGGGDASLAPRASFWSRTSTAWCIDHRPREREGLIDNNWDRQRMVPPEQATDLMALLKRERVDRVDLLKIDIDGQDFEVLEQAAELLADPGLLAVEVEVNFHGEADERHHTFHNTDRTLKAAGFDLFDLSTRSYSLKALPAPFVWDAYAQTEFGRVLQGDAVYFRDPLAAAPADIPDDRWPVLAALGELYGLPDVAAELILAKPERFGGDVTPLLDALTPTLDGERLTYEAYIARFQEDPTAFFPSRAARWRLP